jgi:hypothetical protein
LPPKVPSTGIAVGSNSTLSIDDRTVVTQPGGFAAIANMGTGATSVGADARVGNVWSVGPATLRDRAGVNGFIRSQGTVTVPPTASVSGAVVQNTILTPPDTVTWTVTFPTPGADVFLQPDTSRTLAAGSFGAVTVQPRATLNLSSGTYFMQSLDLESQAHLSLDDSHGPVLLYVANSLIYRASVTDTAANPSAVLLGFAGSAPISIEASFDGTLVAPNASVTVGSLVHHGAFFGKAVEVLSGATILAQGFASLPPGACAGAADGTACDDGNACTTSDHCVAGACTGTAVTCVAPDACHAAACSPLTGACVVADADGKVCDAQGDICVAGVCSTPEAPTFRCATMQVYESQLKSDPAFAAARQTAAMAIAEQNAKILADPVSNLRSGITIIPVVVHVVFNTAAQNLTDAQVQGQISILNQDYRRLNSDASQVPAEFAGVAGDTRVQFALAARDPSCNTTTGITRTQTTVTSFDGTTDTIKAASTGGADPWPAAQYLNIWVGPLQGNLLGRGTFPGTAANIDGIIINTTAFGNGANALAPYNLGRTATHEIGHYLNLLHTFQGGCTGTDPTTCSTAGDNVCDTPGELAAEFGCPGVQNTCTDTPTDLDDPNMDYMDYVDDRCMFMFTAGQTARIQATLAGPRSSLAASAGAIPPPPTSGPWSADTPDDLGDEPNTISTQFYTSEDIWVRNQDDGVATQEHQDPVFRASGPPNHVFVLVRNRGCGTAENANLKLYWAKASSALAWPQPWDGTVTTPALMGQPIGTQSTGVLAAGGSTVLDFSWSPPNPADYSSFGGDATHFCLLSRIETSATAPFGMTFPETSDLGGNVKNNNKIVWKNVSVVGDGGRTGSVSVGPAPGGAPMRLTFTETQDPRPPTSLFTWGTVQVDLGSLIFNKWQAAGGKGSGVTVIPETTTVTLGSSGAFVDAIPLGPGDLSTISVTFVPNATSASNREIPFLYSLDLSETASGQVVGGQRFRLKTFFPAVPKIEPPPIQ